MNQQIQSYPQDTESFTRSLSVRRTCFLFRTASPTHLVPGWSFPTGTGILTGLSIPWLLANMFYAGPSLLSRVKNERKGGVQVPSAGIPLFGDPVEARGPGKQQPNSGGSRFFPKTPGAWNQNGIPVSLLTKGIGIG